MMKQAEKAPVTKGHRGYLKKRKRNLLLLMLVFALLLAGLVVTGLLVTGTVKNFFTIVGLIFAIPFAMQAATFFSLTGFKAPVESEYEKVQEAAGSGVFDTELVVPNKDGASYYYPYFVFHSAGIFALLRGRNTDTKKAAEYVENYLRLHDCFREVRVFTEFEAFLGAIRRLPKEDRETVPESLLQEEGVIRSISM